ncbi:hypothetical protein SAMN04488118_104274 [Epibacterium ulvae]|uniref:Integrase core domain-containing protein n=1 Tax=Epibacterium ulvae TaxID=1156985 RepID=A0A1G5QIN0_9RHOB|nr:transposase [Epibacterium ulvae]SCZ61683.1 hypothetical protein SAMN04488118_104274 [Epibacterium ulvae]
MSQADWRNSSRQRYEVCALCTVSPRAQGKIERWHQILRSRIFLENTFLPGDLQTQIEAFVYHNNYQRYRKSLNNIAPAGVDFTCGKEGVLKQRGRIKRKPLEARRLLQSKRAANHTNQMRQTLPQFLGKKAVQIANVKAFQPMWIDTFERVGFFLQWFSLRSSTIEGAKNPDSATLYPYS